jgi:hypothetical protein
MKKIVGVLALMMLLFFSSCWMLEHPEFTHTETVTQGLGQPVEADGTFESLYHGLLDVSVSIIVTVDDESTYSGNQYFYDVGTNETRAFSISVNTDSKPMVSWRIVFHWLYK